MASGRFVTASTISATRLPPSASPRRWWAGPPGFCLVGRSATSHRSQGSIATRISSRPSGKSRGAFWKSVSSHQGSVSSQQASVAPHDPERARKLLLHRRQIDQLSAQVAERGLTLVPTRLYFKNGRVKVEIAVARGKELRDKRRDIADRETKRRIERELKSRR